MVMGSWLPYVKSHCIPPLKSVINTFILAVLLTTVCPASSRRLRHCLVDKCSEDYHSVEVAAGEMEKCRLLQSHRQCLTDMRVICRGNLLYHTSVHINKQQMKKFHCNEESATGKPPGENDTSEEKNVCSYAGKPKYSFCSLFGDPHVLTFFDKFYTCKANGSWPLINNDYLVVKATNTLLDEDREATAISKITVTIKDSGDCAKHKTYTADVRNSLPATFDDGSQHTGLEESVKVTEIVPGLQVQIDIRFIATTLIMRHVGSHLSFSAQMPEKIVHSPVDTRPQMCDKGCPKRQRIPLMDEIDRLTRVPKANGAKAKNLTPDITPKYSEQEARRRCQEALLGDEDQLSQRAKRSAGRTKTEREGRRSRKNEDLDPSATTWKLLSPGFRSKPTPKKRKPSGRKDRSRMINDDPRPRQAKKSRKRGKGTSKMKRDTNFYFEACVFDLMTTADVMYASSARGAFDDVTRFHQKGSKAPGTRLEMVKKWKPPNTTTTTTTTIQATSNPFTRTKSTATVGRPQRNFPVTTPRNGASRCSREINFVLLIICLLSCSVFNMVRFGPFFGLNYSFFKSSRITTTT